MRKYIAAVEQAAAQTARFMGSQLRNSAANDGWHPEAAASLNVEYKEGKFVASSNHDAAFEHEFGSETSKPKASVRSYGRDSHVYASKAFHSILNNNLKGKK